MERDEKIEKFIQKITKEAGELVFSYYGKIGVAYTKKSVADVVTKADIEANNLIVGAIRKEFPDHGIISEEIDEENIDNEYVWIIDPLDGTRNYSTRTPIFAVSVALARNKKIEFAAVSDPMQQELFYAQRGKGAFRNGEKIHCAKTQEWEHSFGVSTSIFRAKKVEIIKEMIDKVLDKPFWMTDFGSTVLGAVYVADGRRDWFAGMKSHIWDFAAASLICAESGCVVSNSEGGEWGFDDITMIAANKYLYPELLEMAKKRRTN